MMKNIYPSFEKTTVFVLCLQPMLRDECIQSNLVQKKVKTLWKYDLIFGLTKYASLF